MRIEFDIPEAVLHQLLDPVPMPQMARVRYDIPTPAPLRDIGAAVREQMERAGARTMVRPGQRIAVGVGSRGIGRLPEIVAASSASCAPWVPSLSSFLPWAAMAAQRPRGSVKCCCTLACKPAIREAWRSTDQ